MNTDKPRFCPCVKGLQQNTQSVFIRVHLWFLLALLLVAPGVFITGCPPAKSELGLASAPTTTPTPVRAPSPMPANLQDARVVRVVDGDTIEVAIDGKRYTVRYIGINTPETVDPRRPVEYYGKEASLKNKELVDGKTVKLERDVSETDRYGRLLRYVYVNSTFVNAELVGLGYAQASTYPPDVKYADLFRQLEQEARESKRGMWSSTATVVPTRPAPSPTRLRTATPAPPPTATPTRTTN